MITINDSLVPFMPTPVFFVPIISILIIIAIINGLDYDHPIKKVLRYIYIYIWDIVGAIFVIVCVIGFFLVLLVIGSFFPDPSPMTIVIILLYYRSKRDAYCTEVGEGEIAMRKVLLAGVAALFLATGAESTPAHSENGNALLQSCEALEREIRISGDRVWLPNRTDVHKCWDYMSALQDFSVMVDYETGKPLLNSCPGPKTTLTQRIRVFTNYARTHPQELHENASLLVYRAMLEAFPCP